MNIDKLVRYAFGLTLVAAMTFACTGNFQFDDPPGGPGPDAAPDGNPDPATAKDYYNQYVAPIVDSAQENQCSCHGAGQDPVFVGGTTDDTYNYLKDGYPDGALVTSDYSTSPFYTAPSDTHYGAEWQGGEADYVKEWITREYDEYNAPQPAARDIFDQYVNTAIEAKCGCHNGATPVFRGGTPDDTYNYLKANYPNGLIQSTPANSTFYSVAYQQTHQGQQWSPEEATKISDWITAEYAEYSAGQ